MLANESWRILHQPDLLLSRVLKGRYFPSTIFLNATKLSNPSWGWHRILHGRELLYRGLLWHLGSQTRLSLFERPWVPGCQGPEFSILRLPDVRASHIQISSLIRDGAWDRSRLNELFEGVLVRGIASIPLLRTWQMDKPILFFFTVASTQPPLGMPW
ncbi:hypothetical protein LINPERHAP1_LOCUS22997 [Linum perenne]